MEDDLIIINIAASISDEIEAQIHNFLEYQNDLQFIFTEFTIIRKKHIPVNKIWFDTRLCIHEYDLAELEIDILDIITQETAR